MSIQPAVDFTHPRAKHLTLAEMGGIRGDELRAFAKVHFHVQALLGEDAKPNERAAALSLLAYVGRYGKDAYPSVESIGKGAGLGKRATSTRLKALEKRGLVERTPRPGKTTLWKFNLRPLPSGDDPGTAPAEPAATSPTPVAPLSDPLPTHAPTCTGPTHADAGVPPPDPRTQVHGSTPSTTHPAARVDPPPMHVGAPDLRISEKSFKSRAAASERVGAHDPAPTRAALGSEPSREPAAAAFLKIQQNEQRPQNQQTLPPAPPSRPAEPPRRAVTGLLQAAPTPTRPCLPPEVARAVRALPGGFDALAQLGQSGLTEERMRGVAERLLARHASKGVQNAAGLIRPLIADEHDRAAHEAERAAAEDLDEVGEAQVAPAPPDPRALLLRRRSELRGMLVGERSPLARARFEAELLEVEVEIGGTPPVHASPPAPVQPGPLVQPVVDPRLADLCAGITAKWDAGGAAEIGGTPPVHASPPAPVQPPAQVDPRPDPCTRSAAPPRPRTRTWTADELAGHIAGLQAELSMPFTSPPRRGVLEQELAQAEAALGFLGGRA